jgi:hypothetical protein
MWAIHGEGIPAVINALVEESMRVQHADPERTLACVRLIDRIQAHTKPRRP